MILVGSALHAPVSLGMVRHVSQLRQFVLVTAWRKMLKGDDRRCRKVMKSLSNRQWIMSLMCFMPSSCVTWNATRDYLGWGGVGWGGCGIVNETASLHLNFSYRITVLISPLSIFTSFLNRLIQNSAISNPWITLSLSLILSLLYSFLSFSYSFLLLSLTLYHSPFYLLKVNEPHAFLRVNNVQLEYS